ncbi:hypothetical protein FLL45_20940 [Aliikangiella marina]|uniref:Uncharacterized protein n=1 Tax=Aliikangiella marina TaxID=1712262 RepID=A0A545T339_9GAMM|nr:hypothetical protein [Aliikangiella marina]TQV71619.1 hypothetical protein FLL45_20940 [Aliikangiella marina]
MKKGFAISFSVLFILLVATGVYEEYQESKNPPVLLTEDPELKAIKSRIKQIDERLKHTLPHPQHLVDERAELVARLKNRLNDGEQNVSDE